MAERRTRLEGRVALALVLGAGVVAVLVAMVAGVAPDLLAAIAGPPGFLRAVLAGLAIVVGARLLIAAVRRIDGAFQRGPGARPGDISDADLGTMVRGVRLVFLAAASFSAAAGWLLGEPLPIVIALVIAGVDIVETSFLLLVASRRS